MRIVIIGTGNVARVLFERIGRTTHEVVQVVGRRPDVDGYFAATSYVDKLSLVDQSADLYLVAISDNALYELPGQLRLPGCTVAHTAGSVRADVLREVSGAYGVLYPLQTLRAGITGPEVVMPLLVDGADEVVIGRLETFSRDLSVLVRRAGDAERQRLHLAAVVVNNFTNHLYDTAARFCESAGTDFRLLLPLIEQTALQLRNFPPHLLQTGPARRGDTRTLQKHEELLQQHDSLRELYIFLSKAIANQHGHGGS